MDRTFSRGKGQSKKEFHSVYCHNVGKGKPSSCIQRIVPDLFIAIISSVAGVNLSDPPGARGEINVVKRSDDQGSGFPQ